MRYYVQAGAGVCPQDKRCSAYSAYTVEGSNFSALAKEVRLACDYREDEMETQLFFAAMQNKVHYAAAGMTAAAC